MTDQEMREVLRKQDLATLLAVILENSTIIPFRWNANRYRCFYCNTHFMQSSKLRQHTLEEHSDVKVTGCADLIKWRVKLDVSDITCKLCSKKFQTHEQFLDHISNIHLLKFNKNITQQLSAYILSDEEMSCLECGEKIKFFGTLLFHIRKNHNKSKAFLCQVCGESFIDKQYLDKHIKTYHMSSVVHCALCKNQFRSAYLLKKHDDQEHKQTFKCPECPEILSSKYMKRRHLALVHDYKMMKNSCDLCPLVFFSKSNLIKHKVHVHPKERSILCGTCGKTFCSKTMLKLHQVRHDNTRPFQCAYCGRGFRRKKNLVTHMKIHTNDRRFVCQICGKSYTQYKSLQSHIVAHHSAVSKTSKTIKHDTF